MAYNDAIIFQSTRPLRGATQIATVAVLPVFISIHAPLAGRDLHDLDGVTDPEISIHAPLAGRDIKSENWDQYVMISIHAPLAGRDCLTPITIPVSLDFNPRAPCGARHLTLWRPSYITLFQSTRPLRGATTIMLFFPLRTLFQSTRPLRGATQQHPPAGRCCRYFNPRAPCGARPRGS